MATTMSPATRGTGGPLLADGSVDPVHAYGWFVGWVVKDGRTILFARLIQDDRDETVRAGLQARAEMIAALPALLRADTVRPGFRR